MADTSTQKAAKALRVACTDGNVRLKDVANKVLGVSAVTVFNWRRGTHSASQGDIDLMLKTADKINEMIDQKAIPVSPTKTLWQRMADTTKFVLEALDG